MRADEWDGRNEQCLQTRAEPGKCFDSIAQGDSNMKTAALALLLGLASTAIAAKDVELAIPPTRLSPAGVSDMAREIRSGMKEGGRFQWVSQRERIEVERDLNTMVNILSGLDSVAELKPAQRVELFNAQARANALLGQRDGNRLVCERRRRTGSKLSETWCESYAERMERQRIDRRALREVTDTGYSTLSTTPSGASNR